MKHLKDDAILTNLNHGFKSCYSCEFQLQVTMEDFVSAYDSNIQVDCHMKFLQGIWQRAAQKVVTQPNIIRFRRSHTWMVDTVPHSRNNTGHFRRQKTTTPSYRGSAEDHPRPRTIVVPHKWPFSICTLPDTTGCRRVYALPPNSVSARPRHITPGRKWANSWDIKFNAKKMLYPQYQGKQPILL